MTAANPELIDSLAVDAAEVATFLGKSDSRFFDYEYRRFRPDVAVFIQARVDGRLIGTQGLLPYPLMIGGRPMMSGRAERARVDPKWRTGGVFAQLVRTCARRGADHGYDLIWGMTGQKVPFQRNGFLYFDGFFEHALLCLAPGAITSDLARPQAGRMRTAKLAIAVPSLCMRAAARLRHRTGFATVSRPRRDDDVDQLFKRLTGRTPLVVMRHDAAFLRWLLDDGRAAERFYVYDNEALVAYAYVDVSRGTTASVLDFAASDATSMRVLIAAIARGLAGRGFAFLSVSYNRTNPLLARQRAWLVMAGFVPFHRGGGFIMRPLRFQDFNYLSDLSRWYVTRLWNTLYPRLEET